MPMVEPFLRLVCLSVFDAFMFLGALQVAGFATIRPLRVPLVQRYLRTVLLPLLPKIVVTPSSMLSVYRSRNSISYFFRLRACTLLLAGLMRLVFLALRIILPPSLALVFLKAIRFLMSGAAKHCAILATTLFLRGPLEQRYLRTTFFPERAQV